MDILERANDMILETRQDIQHFNQNLENFQYDYWDEKAFHLGVFSFVVLTALFGVKSVGIGLLPWIYGRRRRRRRRRDLSNNLDKLVDLRNSRNYIMGNEEYNR